MKTRLQILSVGALLTFSTLLVAQNASLTVIHAIPNLPAPVQVFANGNSLFSFDFTDQQGPLSLPAGAYNIDIQLMGSSALSGTVTLVAGENYTAVAHLQVGGALALSLFNNDISALIPGETRVTVRHLADAPAVDILQQRQSFLNPTLPSVLFGNVTNPNEGVADVPEGFYGVTVNAAGTSTSVAGPVVLDLPRGQNTLVYAVGVLGTPSFQLLLQTIDLRPRISAVVSGVSGGGTIGVSNNAPNYGEAFQVTLTGGAPGAFGLLHIGTSQSSFLFFPLPLDLTGVGAAGNFLYQNDVQGTGTVLDANGDQSLSFVVPQELIGLFDAAYAQFSYGDASANALGWVFSDLLTVDTP